MIERRVVREEFQRAVLEVVRVQQRQRQHGGGKSDHRRAARSEFRRHQKWTVLLQAQTSSLRTRSTRRLRNVGDRDG